MTNPVTVSVRLGDISNAIGSLIADGASTIPLLTGNTPLTPIQVLNGVDLLVSTVGASATVLKNFAEVFERFPNVVGPLQAAGVVANAATVSSGFTKIVDAFARNDSEQFAVGLLDVIGGGAGLLGLIAAYTPLATLIQGSALIAKTYIGSNPGALAAAIKDLTKGFDSLLGAIGSAVNTNFTSALNWTAPRDPLVLDLDGDGIEAVGINPANPVTFDHDADGLRTGTGWIKADDGLVVLDLNGNGTIDTGRELFGDNTLLPNGQTASNGYQALGQHDTNGDGRINSQDTIYTQLRVWQDANQDGISQTNELRTLAQVGIASINTAGAATNINLGNGNSQPFSGSFTRTDGSAGASGVAELSGSLLLAANNFYRTFTDKPVTTAAAQALPQMRGSGWVRDMREAMSLGTPAATTLQQRMAAYSAATTRAGQMALLDGVIEAWAATTGRVRDNPTERVFPGNPTITLKLMPQGMSNTVVTNFAVIGPVTSYNVTAEGQQFLRRLNFLEAFNGSNFFELTRPAVAASIGLAQSSGGGGVGGVAVEDITAPVTINQAQIDSLNQSWDALAGGVYQAMALQTRLKPYLDSVELVISDTGITFSTGAMNAQLDAALASDPTRGLTDLIDLNRFAQSTFTGVGYDGLGKLRAAIDALPAASPLRGQLLGFGVYTGAVTTGSATNDIYFGSSANETFTGGAGNDALSGGSGDDTLNGGDGNDTLNGDAGNDSLQGDAGNDTLNGGIGNDSLYGDAGNDTLDGGAGNDYLVGGLGNNTYLFGRGDGQDLVQSSPNDTTPGKLNTLQLKAGVATSDVLIKQTYDNYLGGNRALEVSIAGTADKITFNGYSYNDDTANGYNSVQQIRFDDGTVWDLATIKAILTNRAPTATLLTDQTAIETQLFTYTVPVGAFMDLDVGDTLRFAAVMANGAALPAWLTFDAATQTLSGTPPNTAAGALAFKITATDRVGLSVSANLNLDIANIVSGDSGNNTLLGTAGRDVIYGLAGNDTLNGGLGADTMLGGLGNDTYVVDNAGDIVTELAGEGTDTVQSSISYTLTDNVENLSLTGTAAINGTGNALNNVLTGNVANNVLTGGVGNDTINGGAGTDSLVGGAGNDTYTVDNVGDTVIELTGEGTDKVQTSVSYTLSDNVENLTLTGTAVLTGTGNALANVLTGNTAASTLRGLDGDDTLTGGTGATTLIGGAGNDTYNVNNASDIVVEAAGEGTDTVNASVSYTLTAEVENLTLTGTTAIDGTGNALANALVGNAAANTLSGGDGNDVLNGGAGADMLIGGWGDDSYVVDNAGDTIIEHVAEGIDSVSSVVSYTLSDNIENLTLTGSTAINATGNSLNNVLTGNSGANVLSGGAGNDTVNGGAGADTLLGGLGDDFYFVDNTGDVATENAGEGLDTVSSSIAYTLTANLENLTLTGTGNLAGTGNGLNNRLIGNAGANTLNGGDGDDYLDGKAGNDTLVGGAGNDTYFLARGYGTDTIQENDATVGNLDIARFDAGIATDQLWFRKDSNNLEVSVIGTADKFTISNWYLGSQYRVEQFKTSDGKTLLDSQVQNLVQAMASFAPPAAGQTTLNASQQAALTPVLAANWQ